MCPWGWKAIKFPSDPWRQFRNIQYVKWDCFCICMFNLFLLKTIIKDLWTMIALSNELAELFSIDSHRFTVRPLLLLGKWMSISLNEFTLFPSKKRCNHTLFMCTPVVKIITSFWVFHLAFNFFQWNCC